MIREPIPAREPVPVINPELVEWLKRIYPNRLPESLNEFSELLIAEKLGRQAVIRRLELELNRQQHG